MGRKRVLVVDDSRENRMLCCDLLQLLPVETLSASDGRDALSLVRDHAPDLILMDMQMPVMDGVEAAAALQSAEETRHIPIIALSGGDSDVGRHQALEAGCADYLHKPYDTNALLTKVKHHLGLT